MPTEFIYFQGKGSWIRAAKPDRTFIKPDGTGSKWDMILHPNEQSLEKIRELQAEGVKNKLNEDEDGYFVRLSRPEAIKVRGRLKEMKPPVLTKKDGSPFNDMVGNGSDVTVKMEVYEHKTPNGGKAKAMRWLSLRIDHLVPYTGRREMDYDERAVKGLEEQPEQKPDW